VKELKGILRIEEERIAMRPTRELALDPGPVGRELANPRVVAHRGEATVEVAIVAQITA
jgi:hypothetical protein